MLALSRRGGSWGRGWSAFKWLMPCMLVAALCAQQAVDPLAALRAMEVDGVGAFDRDRIAGALVMDEVALRALRRPLDAEAAAAIAERVQELHRRGGYVEATARAEVQDGVLRVRLQTGARYRCGPIEVAGNAAVATARLQEVLTAVTTAPPHWPAGRYPRGAREAMERRAAAAIVGAFREVGRHGAVVRVEARPDAEQLVLHVQIADEGHEVRAQAIGLVGEDEATAAAVLAQLRFAPGALVTSALLDDLQRQLEATGRYLAVRPAVPETAPAQLAKLDFAVQLRPNAPAPAAIRIRDAEQLRRAFDVALADLRAGHVLRFEFAIPEPMEWQAVKLLPGKVAFAVGRDGFTAEVERLQWGTAAPARAAFELVGDRLAIDVGGQQVRWRFGTVANLQIQLSTTFDAAGEANARWGVGVSTNARELLVVSLHPATAAKMLASATSSQRDGDELQLTFPRTSFRLGADGRVVGGRFEATIHDGQVVFQMANGPLVAALSAGSSGAAATAVHPARLVLEGGCRLVRAWLDEAKLDPSTQRMLQLAIDAAPSLPIVDAPPAEAEDPPSLVDDSPSMPQILAGWAGGLVVDRRTTGELVALATPFAALLRGDGALVRTQFRALGADDEHGPLCLGVAAVLLGLLGSEGLANVFRDTAIERCNFDAFYADAADLAADLGPWQHVPAWLGSRWRQDEQLRALLGPLPAGAAGDLLAWRKGLEHAWAHGGEALLRRTLLAK